MALHVLRTGQGPQLLMLHGIGGSATAWNKQIERLSADFTCLAPDLPGYGDSSVVSEDGLMAILNPIADLIGNEPTHVLGVSFGALLALTLAHHHPQKVRSLVLADATLGRAHLAASQRAQWLQKRLVLSQKLQTVSIERAAEIASPNASATAIDEIALHMRRARPEGYMAVANIIAATDARPWLTDISQPTLVLCGEDDNVTGPEVSETLAGSLPDARLQTIAKAGHAPHIEQPDMFAEAVRKFILNL